MAEGGIDCDKHVVEHLWCNVVVVYDRCNREVHRQRRPVSGGRYDHRRRSDGIDDVEQRNADRHRYDKACFERVNYCLVYHRYVGIGELHRN